ncbi:transport ATP-binding protein CydC [Halalkalibacter wakoensis JCM 9140]|uniref:Transport ATP-binding protein CydC n=1 Tax=Halalkalibacter wakoensis JCM 9140 TaxID=1236970 RepID=W4Q2C6_9BACI|nr:thiol reductant ABC exporter subunit CydC [Halalkalibacter wakoensis]GAE26090.1 transport ATP-binding protein CydC [Halalkalibacter wakoensis JCM 9140]
MRELQSVMKTMFQQKRDVVLSILFGFIAGIAAVGLFAANGYLISQAALEPPLYVLIAMVAVVKIGSFIRALSRYGERYYSHRATFTMLSDLRVHFYEKLEKLGPTLFQKYRSGDLLARIVGDVESLQNFFLRVFYPPIVMALVFLSTILFVSFYSFSIVLVFLLGLLLTGVLIPAWFAKKQRKVSSRVLEERSVLSTETAEWFYGFRELTIHQKQREKHHQLVAASERYIKEQEREGLQSVSYQSINSAVTLLISWLVIVIGALAVSNGQLDGIFLAMLIMISFILFEHAVPMALFPIHYDESERAASRLYSVNKEADQEKIEETKLTNVSKSVPSIEANGITFAFPEAIRNTLTDVQVKIPSGSKTAIVGPSGSGKSTLLKLLLKQYESTGDLFVNGVSINELHQEQVWEMTKVVLQENHFFYGTIKDNLLLTNDQYTDEDLIQLLERVQLSHFSLEDQVLERGQNLSGGEKQRLAMARAIAKKGHLWLLDEPTSSLDAWTEQRLYEALFKEAKDDTVILVSHRLAGLENMDQIIVMENGKVIETGSFEQLMNNEGYFYHLKQIEKSVVA